jgi:hypothetical protein
MREVSEEEYAKLVDSSIPPPKRPQSNTGPKWKNEYSATVTIREESRKEYEEMLRQRGLIYCKVDGVKRLYPLSDCVVHKSGAYTPKIEYLMDVLGPQEVQRRLRDAGLHWKKVGNGNLYRELIHKLTLEVAKGE